MLILVAVTISILINSGLIGKAQKAKSDTQTAYLQEQKLGDSINIDGVVYNNIDDIIGYEDGSDEIKSVVVNEFGIAYIIMGNGDVYKATFNVPTDGHFCNLKDANIEETPIATNVKKFYDEGYYITNSNELYGYYEKTAENVKEYDGRVLCNKL